MKLYVAGYKGAGFGGRFIKWFTFGGYSHVSLIFVQGETRIEIDALQGAGVTSRNDGNIKNERDLFLVKTTEKQFWQVYNAAVELIGTKYDWRGIYGFLARRKRENSKKWFCSELVAHCLDIAGIKLLNLPPWKISPVMVCASTVIEKVKTEME